MNERRWIPACAGMTFEKLYVCKTVIPAQAGIQRRSCHNKVFRLKVKTVE
jgi:hypothetical protein